MSRKAAAGTAAQAVAKVIHEQQHCHDEVAVVTHNTSGSSQTGGRKRCGVRAVATALDGDAISRLAQQAAGQQSQLLHRLVSHDPTRKSRAERQHVAAVVNRDTSVPGEQNVSTASTRGKKRPVQRHVPRNDTAPITITEFDQKYASDDAMLRYLLHVVAHSKSVVRADIPRHRQGNPLGVAVQNTSIPEEDALFLAYHTNPPCGFRNVYWLTFIAEDRAVNDEHEYFTLSHHGLTHFCGVTVIDFTDPESWITEKRAFDYMTSMRGLQKLQELLFFLSWKRKAIHLKHRRVRARLACSLFHCDPVAARLMIHIRECCVEIEQSATLQSLPAATALAVEQISQLNRAHVKSIRIAVFKQANTICELIDREIRDLQVRREKETEAEKLNYANVSRTTRLLERLYTFLRLADLHLFESISEHLNRFLATLHVQLCGQRAVSTEFAQKAHEELGSTITSTIGRQVSSTDKITSVCYNVLFCLRRRAVPVPFVSGRLDENVEVKHLAGKEIQMTVSPTQSEVFEVVYGLLNGYISSLDATPQVLSNLNFRGVMAPYTPQNREGFLSSLLRPSTQILQQQASKLKEMKNAIDTYYKQLEIQVSDRLRLVGEIHAAEECERSQKESNKGFGSASSTKLLTAEQHEEVSRVWASLLVEIKATSRVIQIGVVLLDQSSLLDRLEAYVTKHISCMMEDLPYVYKQFLCDLLSDVDGRVDRVMNIPTSISDAIVWLKEMMEMMPSHGFRQSFDLKCSNLAQLKQMLKDHGVTCRTPEEQDALKKKDFEWESTYETLIICLARVQERESEHRRSVMELSSKADDFVAMQLKLIKEDFNKFPDHEAELLLDKRRTKELDTKKQDIVMRLERLVALEGDREEMVDKYGVFAHEHRLLTEHDAFDTQDQTAHSSPSWSRNEALPSEQLLQHVSILIEMRSWFASWKSLEEKWLDTPVVTVHASIVLSRIKQFRRRLLFASTRLLPVSSEDGEEFRARDQRLVDDLRTRVDRMTSNYVIFQAATCGAFTSERWGSCRALLGQEAIDSNRITLRMIQTRSDAPGDGANQEFKALCEVVLVDAKLRSHAERLRQRISMCHVTAQSSSYRVLLTNIQAIVLELDDLAIESKMLVQASNPNLENACAVLDEIDTKLALCDQLLSFQKRWEELSQLARVNDIDEFFTGQVAWKGPVQRQKKKVGRDESIWAEFVDASQQWNERLRRLVCMCQTTSAATTSSQQATDLKQHGGSSPLPSTDVACAVDDVLQAFQGFDFAVSVAKCELAHQLVDKYIASLRGKCPRLYMLSKLETIQLLVYEDDIPTLQRALRSCFPHIPTFSIERSRKQGDQVSANGLRGAASDGTGAIIMKGFKTALVEREFSVPVVKVGRLKFWFTRLEEEISAVVMENAKQSVEDVLLFTAAPRSAPLYEGRYSDQFVQSLVVALNLQFTSAVRRIFEAENTDDDANGDDGGGVKFVRMRESHGKLLDAVVAFTCSATGSVRNDPRLDSMILQLQYQAEVMERMHMGIQADAITDTQLVWETQFKIDFVVEDTTTKTFRRMIHCDSDTWLELVALGPSFPISFIANIAQSEFTLGREFVGMDRVPVVTPLTQRCVFEIFQVLHASALPLVAPLNEAGRGGHRSIIRGAAQMIMKPLAEITCSMTMDMVRFDNLLSSVVAIGSFLSIFKIESLDLLATRRVIGKLKQLQDDVQCKLINVASVVMDHRPAHFSRPTACIFVPLNRTDLEERNSTSAFLSKSVRELLYPVAITLPTVSYFAKMTLLLAGYTMEQIPKLKSVVSFFNSFSRLCPTQQPTSSSIYRLISQVMQEIARLRGSTRVLLPSNPRWSQQFAKATANGSRRSKKQVCSLFRRSADGQDTADVVVHTLFHHVLHDRYRACLSKVAGSNGGAVESLLEQCFPSFKGCEVAEKVTKTKDDLLWEAMEMSLTHSGLTANGTLLEKAMELASILQTSATVVVLGDAASGKSTCLKTLHNALEALEMTETADGEDTQEAHAHTRQAGGRSHLVYVSSRYLDDHQFMNCFPIVSEISESTPRRQWLCFDGVLDPSTGEAVCRRYRLQFDGRQQSPTMLTEQSPRLIFETTCLDAASPSFVVLTRILHVSRLMTQADIVASWRGSWMQRLPFPDESRGAENAALIFSMTEELLRGAVAQFISAEESGVPFDSVRGVRGENTNEMVELPTHFGMLSVLHLTQTCLHLIGATCFLHRAQLEELAAANVARIVAFCVLWGFTGHLSDHYRHKLDQLLRAELKRMSAFKRVNEIPGDLFDSERLGGGGSPSTTFWDSIELPLRGVPPPVHSNAQDQTKSSVNRLIYDRTKSGNDDRILVLTTAATPLVRVIRLLIQSNLSFVLVGPRGCGKSSFLRMLWLMNEEDQTAEAMVDASLAHRFAATILNWQAKPRTWFTAPLNPAETTSQHRCRANDEAQLFAAHNKAGAATMVFLDDLALPDGDMMDEFVRVALDHRSAVNRTDLNIQPLSKAFGATMTNQKSFVPKQSLPGTTERLLRHFAVFHMPMYDRAQLQGIFRHVYHNYFEIICHTSASSSSSSSTRLAATRRERVLSLPEIVLRACVDVATDALTVQQASDRGQLVKGFTFNLHHLDTVLARTFAFSHFASRSAHGQDNGATLLSLGKLQQCWVSVMRHVFLLACSDRAPSTTVNEDDITALLAVDEFKKITQSTKKTSEKYFSAPMRVEPRATRLTDIVYGTYRFLIDHASVTEPMRSKLEELLTSNASATSSGAAGKREKIAQDGGSTSGTNVPAAAMGRDEYAVRVAAELLFEVTAPFVAGHALSMPIGGDFGAAARLKLRLHLSSTIGLHQLLHLLDAIAHSANLLIDTPLAGTQQQLVRLAFAMHHFKVVTLDPSHSPEKLVEQWHDALLEAGVKRNRVALWVDLTHLQHAKIVVEWVLGVCLGKIPPILFESQRLRNELLTACVQDQKELSVLTDDDVLAHFRHQLADNFRLCIVAGEKDATSDTTLSLIELMRGSSSFQWVCLAAVEGEYDLAQYRKEIVEHANAEMRGQQVVAVTRKASTALTDTTTTSMSATRGIWNWLHLKCNEFFSSDWDEQHFLSFVGNVVVNYQRREHEAARQRQCHEQVVHALEQINERVPQLMAKSQTLVDRIQQLSEWYDELEMPTQLLMSQHEQRLQDFRDQEDQLTAEEIRSMQWKLKKLETQVWAHHSMRQEYDLARTELSWQKRAIDDESHHWDKYKSVRDSMEHRLVQQRDDLVSVRDDPTWLLRQSVGSVAHVFHSSPPTSAESGAYEETDPISLLVDDVDHQSYRLWRARFPFLQAAGRGSRGDRILSTIDSVHDRIPLIVDPCGLMQYVLVHIFSNLVWFSDRNDDHERHDAASGGSTIKSMVIQCDGSEKMWLKLREAVEKQLPTLLVGVSAQQLPRVASFVRQHTTGTTRDKSLSQLTQDSYRLQRKREEQHTHPNPHPHAQTKKSIRTGDLVMPMLSPTESSKTTKATNTPKAKNSVSATVTPSQRGGLAPPDASRSSTRRASLVLAASTGDKTSVSPPRGRGFQLYAVTQHAMPAVENNDVFLDFQIHWDPLEVEAFFLESWTRRYDKKLHKELADARRADCDAAHQVAQAETALWSVVGTTIGLSSINREFFMRHLESLHHEFDRYVAHVQTAQARMTALSSLQAAYTMIARQMAHVARCATRFATLVALPPSNSCVHSRSYRFYEQLLDQTALAMLANSEQADSDDESKISVMAKRVTNDVVHTIVASMISPSHQHIFLLFLSIATSHEHTTTGEQTETDAATAEKKKRTELLEAALVWLMHGGLAQWSNANPSQEKKPPPPPRRYDLALVATSELSSASSSYPATVSSSTSAASIVDRLRRKVRVCSLLFDQIGRTKDKTSLPNSSTKTDHEATIKTTTKSVIKASLLSNAKPAPATPHDSSSSSSALSVLLTEGHKTFRGIACLVKTLWCEWKLAKEDQRGDVSRAIALLQGNANGGPSPLVVTMKYKPSWIKEQSHGPRARVTQIFSLSDIAPPRLALGTDTHPADESAGISGRAPATVTIEQRLASLMLAKVFFPQLLLTEWNSCLTGSPRSTVSTSHVLGMEAAAAPLPVHLQLPPSIDVAWKRSDLVHLPTRVLLYEPTSDRVTLDVLLLRASTTTTSTSSGSATAPLRVFSVIDLFESEPRVRAQLTAAITSKERFAIELSSARHFDAVVSLVSHVINQHALLCIPEWFLICDTEVFGRLQSHAMGFLHIHFIRRAAEQVCVENQLTQWLVHHGGLSDRDAEMAAHERMGTRSGGTRRHRPLACAVEAVVAQYKAITTLQPAVGLAERQNWLKQLLFHDRDTKRDDVYRTKSKKSREHARDVICKKTNESLQFLSELLSLPSQQCPSQPVKTPQQEERTKTEKTVGLPGEFMALATQLELLCKTLTELHGFKDMINTSKSALAMAPWWCSLMDRERQATLALTQAFLCLLRSNNDGGAAPSSTAASGDYQSRERQQQHVLVAHGLVPTEWIANHLPHLSSVACTSKVVSLAQLTVLVVSRLGFQLHAASGDPLATLHMSLLDDPCAMFHCLAQSCAASVGGQVTFTLEPIASSVEDSSSPATVESSKKMSFRNAPRTQSSRNYSSRRFPQAIDRITTTTSVATGPTQAQEQEQEAPLLTTTCIVTNESGQICGLQIEGLVVVERVISRRHEPQMFLHELPPCRLVCSASPPPSSSSSMANDSSAAGVDDPSPSATAQRYEALRLTTIVSTTAFQTIPECFWSPPLLPREQDANVEGINPTDDLLLRRGVALAPSLVAALPGVSRLRDPHDLVSFVVAMPAFSADDDDSDVM